MRETEAAETGSVMTAGGERSLTDLDPHVWAVVLGVRTADAAELATEGLRPGSLVSVVARAPLGGPLVVRLGRVRVAVPRAVATGVIVGIRAHGTDR
jgi:Fe2+ transport system protein FeoA